MGRSVIAEGLPLDGNMLAQDLDHILDHTRPLWEDLRGERVFIAGGTGFLGCWLLESFVWANQRLNLKASATVLTRNVNRLREKVPHLVDDPSLHVVEADIISFAALKGRHAFAVHAAVGYGDGRSDSQEAGLIETMLTGTERLVRIAAKASVERLLLVSTGAVYGPQPANGCGMSEEWSGAPDPLDPGSFYAEVRRAMEALCMVLGRRYNIQVPVARGFSFVGPYLPLNGQFAIGNFLRDSLLGDPITIRGDGTPCRSYLYAADAAIWLWTVLFRGDGSRAYNVGSDIRTTIREAADAVAEVVRPRPSVVVSGIPGAGVAGQEYVPAVTRARSELGLQQWIPLGEAIARTVEWERRRMAKGVR